MCLTGNYACRRQRFCRRMRWRRGKIVFGIICLCFALVCWIMSSIFTVTTTIENYCEPIDVVYTWVNGSDPNFIVSVQEYSGGSSYDPARFDDKNELKFSLRSLERYAPWVRHIYIVTNQIPNWLDLNNKQISIVPHELISPNIDFLPTFSSAAIETFLHRIPKLSKRFLYLNDDIFLGTPLYPEDLYTESEGVHIYQAWMVPDCAEDCPWTYIGDGACDRHCNIAACQYDGGDCSVTGAEQAHVFGSQEESMQNVLKSKQHKNISSTIVRRFPLRKQFRKHKNVISFKQLMRQKNYTTLNELQRLVEAFNKRLNIRVPQSQSTQATFDIRTSAKIEKHSSSDPISTKDIYSQSLIYTNMLLNRHYGFKARNVLAHVGFLLDREIIDEMQTKLADEVLATASHRFRAVSDLQFSFAYYTFLMSEKITVSVEQIFDEFDTDLSGTWSDREVRTFLTRMFPVVDWPAMHFFEEVIGNCTHNMVMDDTYAIRNAIFSTLAYERYEDSNLPTIMRDLVSKCPLLSEAMASNLGARPKYKYKVNSKRNAHSNFMMLTSNVSEVTYELDRFRRFPRKFNCINDNLNPKQFDDNALIRNLLEDFYISFFPQRSKFELPLSYRNRFSTWQDYHRWRRRKRAGLVIGYSATILLMLFILRFLVLHKTKVMRRCIHRIFRI